MSLQLSAFSSVIDEFRTGNAVIMVDDENRENEGDLIVASELVTEEHIALMLREARGLICASLSSESANRLNLPLQTLNNNSVFQTPFAVGVDHIKVASQGVTARARAFTIKHLVDSTSRPYDFVSPGHVFPLIAHPAGVLGRQGQTEGSFDLARLAGLQPSGVLCEILNPDGSMARGEQLTSYAARFGLKLTSVAEVIRHRIKSEVLVREEACGKYKTDYGTFLSSVFIDDVDGKEHLVLQYGPELMQQPDHAPLVRVHSECLTGDVFTSRRCDCGKQLAGAARKIVAEGAGVVLYLRQEGRGIGLGNKVKAYALQDNGSDTVEANVRLGFKPDERDFAVAAKILNTLGISKIRLMTNNPDKVNTLKRFGLTVVERVPIIAEPDECSREYLETKRQKMGHWL
jgi:3,4-dihydroxy 2-butanone 4-phosphate synthase / GTP cyclohydrolase II